MYENNVGRRKQKPSVGILLEDSMCFLLVCMYLYDSQRVQYDAEMCLNGTQNMIFSELSHSKSNSSTAANLLIASLKEAI